MKTTTRGLARTLKRAITETFEGNAVSGKLEELVDLLQDCAMTRFSESEYSGDKLAIKDADLLSDLAIELEN